MMLFWQTQNGTLILIVTPPRPLIDVELGGLPMARVPADSLLFAEVEAQQRAHQLAYQDALEAERAVIAGRIVGTGRQGRRQDGQAAQDRDR